MASKFYYFKGMIKWAKVQKPDQKYNNYTLDFFLDEESMKMFKDSKLNLKLREAEEGTFVKFRRPVSKTFNGEVVDLGPPKVLIKDAEGEYQPFSGLIGNGSEGVVKIRVYDSQMGKGHELDTVAVDSLVEYEEGVGGDDLPF